MKTLIYIYWFFIFILQVVLIAQKIESDAFYIWNLVALASAAVFLFTRFTKRKVRAQAEITMAFFIAINGVTTAIAQLILLRSLFILSMAIIVAVFSGFMVYQIWKMNKEIVEA